MLISVVPILKDWTALHQGTRVHYFGFTICYHLYGCPWKSRGNYFGENVDCFIIIGAIYCELVHCWVRSVCNLTPLSRDNGRNPAISWPTQWSIHIISLGNNHGAIMHHHCSSSYGSNVLDISSFAIDFPKTFSYITEPIRTLRTVKIEAFLNFSDIFFVFIWVISVFIRLHRQGL